MPTTLDQSEIKPLLKLIGPILFTQMAGMGNGVIDTIMAGRYSSVDLAGVAIGNAFWIPVTLLLIGLVLALSPTISAQLGGQKHAEIKPTFWQGIWLALALCPFLIAATYNIPHLFEAFSVASEIRPIASGYLQALAWGVPASAGFLVFRYFNEGMSKPGVVTLVTLIGLAFNTLANWVFIYGHWGFAEMGGIGCGWATALANGLMFLCLASYTLLTKRYRRYALLHPIVLPQRQRILQLISLGAPIGATLFIETSCFTLVAALMAVLGADIVAAHSVALNVASILFMLPLSVALALTVRISFHLGEGKLQRAKRASNLGLIIALIFALASSTFMALFYQIIPAWYSNEPKVIEVAGKLLFFAALFQLVDAIQCAALGALRGYKDTKRPFYIALFCYWVVTLPLAYTLGLTDLIIPAAGAEGFWAAMVIGLFLAAILLGYRLHKISNRSLNTKARNLSSTAG